MLRPSIVCLAAATLLALAAWAAEEQPAGAAASAVVDFNLAVTERDMDKAMDLLADGSVQFQLRAAHPGMAENPPLTADAATMWKTVGAILFPTTDSYERRVEVLNTEVHGELAVVWTQTQTVTHRKGKAEPMVLDFSEMYFLVNKNGQGWRIAGNASNRPVDDIPVG